MNNTYNIYRRYSLSTENLNVSLRSLFVPDEMFNCHDSQSQAL